MICVRFCICKYNDFLISCVIKEGLTWLSFNGWLHWIHLHVRVTLDHKYIVGCLDGTDFKQCTVQLHLYIDYRFDLHLCQRTSPLPRHETVLDNGGLWLKIKTVFSSCLTCQFQTHNLLVVLLIWICCNVSSCVFSSPLLLEYLTHIVHWSFFGHIFISQNWYSIVNTFFLTFT